MTRPPFRPFTPFCRAPIRRARTSARRRALPVLLALVTVVNACAKTSASQTAATGQTTLDLAQRDPLDFIVKELSKDFNLAPGIDPDNKAEVIAYKIEHSLDVIEKAQPSAAARAMLTPAALVAILTKVYVPRIEVLPDHLGITPPPAKRLALSAAAIVPIMTKIVTANIRRQVKSPGLRQTALGATPLQGGPFRDLVFKAIQKEYPQLDPSGRVNNVYVVADFHRLTLRSLYIESAADVRALLTIADLKTRLPSLERIVAASSSLSVLAPNMGHEAALRPDDYPSGLTLVLTDKLAQTDVSRAADYLAAYPGFARLFTGLGFLAGLPTDVARLGKLIGPQGVQAIELNPSLLSPATVLLVEKKLPAQIVLNPVDLVRDYNAELPHIFTPVVGQGCKLWHSRQMDKDGLALLRLASTLLKAGHRVSIPPLGQAAAYVVAMTPVSR